MKLESKTKFSISIMCNITNPILNSLRLSQSQSPLHCNIFNSFNGYYVNAQNISNLMAISFAQRESLKTIPDINLRSELFVLYCGAINRLYHL